MALLSSGSNNHLVGLRAGNSPGASPGIGKEPWCGACHRQPCTHRSEIFQQEVDRSLERLLGRRSTKLQTAVMVLWCDQESRKQEGGEDRGLAAEVPLRVRRNSIFLRCPLPPGLRDGVSLSRSPACCPQHNCNVSTAWNPWLYHWWWRRLRAGSGWCSQRSQGASQAATPPSASGGPSSLQI